MKNLIPFMSLRGSALFPTHPMALEIGRPFSIASIKKSLQDNVGVIVVTAQKFISMNEGPDLSQVYSVGCKCQITESVDFPDGYMKIRVTPLERVQIESLEDIGGARYCQVTPLSSFITNAADFAEKKNQIQNALTIKLGAQSSERASRYLKELQLQQEPFDFVMGVGHLLGMLGAGVKELTVEQMKQGLFAIDAYSDEERKNIDLQVARIQEILECTEAAAAMRKIEVLL